MTHLMEHRTRRRLRQIQKFPMELRMYDDELSRFGYERDDSEKALNESIDFNFNIESKPIITQNGLSVWVNPHNGTVQDRRGDFVWRKV